jgi:hypothetical protein
MGTPVRSLAMVSEVMTTRHRHRSSPSARVFSLPLVSSTTRQIWSWSRLAPMTRHGPGIVSVAAQGRTSTSTVVAPQEEETGLSILRLLSYWGSSGNHRYRVGDPGGQEVWKATALGDESHTHGSV